MSSATRTRRGSRPARMGSPAPPLPTPPVPAHPPVRERRRFCRAGLTYLISPRTARLLGVAEPVIDLLQSGSDRVAEDLPGAVPSMCMDWSMVFPSTKVAAAAGRTYSDRA